MDIQSLNSHSKSKRAFIEQLISCEADNFDLAVCLQQILEHTEFSEGRSLIIAEGPKHLSELLAGIQGEGSNRRLVDQLTQHRMISAQYLLGRFKKLTNPDKVDELRKMIFWDLNFQLSHAISRQIMQSAIFFRLYNDFPKLIQGGYSFEDADWIGFYQILNQNLGVEKGDNFGFEFLMSGGFACFFFGQVNLILKKPCVIKRNQNLVLHNDEGPAVKWQDGTSLYFWNGIEVNKKLIEFPDTISREDILAEKNVEVRRVYQEALGSERFANLLGLLPIDVKKDRFGNTMILYRTIEKDKLIGEHIHFAKVICPSTGRNYFLCVPPKISSVDEAVAWTFGKNAREYKPERET